MPKNQGKDSASVSRRGALRTASALAAGATAWGSPVANEKHANDLAILNVALGLEHQAIAAYDAGAKSKLLTDDQLKIAVSFQADHKRHRDALSRFVRHFGGTPVEPKSSYDFGTITTGADVVKLAQHLEEQAEMAYLTNAGNLQDRELLNAAVPILEDEVRHNILFRQLLGMDVTERLKY